MKYGFNQHCCHPAIVGVRRTIGIVVSQMCLWLFLATGSFAEEPNFYRDIRPILAKACFHCHGPDEETREADLRLDRPEGLFSEIDGRTIVTRGDADHSEIVKRILSNDPDLQMPPADSGKSLTETQKSTLIAWINAGANWQEHWAFIAPRLPKVPDPSIAAGKKASWSGSEIDRFVLQKQIASGLAPSVRAVPEAQVRRVFLDLIGLPPTVDEAKYWTSRLREEGVSGISGDSVWSQLVDHLLARPEYGERWARSWLDLARYADTNGYEKDRPRSIWPYRDWVIHAINDDMPFDQFTIEQIAGDLLPNATVSQKIATGFHRNTMLNEEGGIDPLEFRFHAMTDRVATTGTTWLGLTVGCAQCHTHKYDPLTHRNYYQLMAFLNNADEPSMALPDESLQTTHEANLQQAAKLLDELPSQWPISTFHETAITSMRVRSDSGERFSIDASNTVKVRGTLPQKTVYVVDIELSDIAETSLVRLTAAKSKGLNGPGRGANGNFVLNEIKISVVNAGSDSEARASEMELPVSIKSVSATVEQTNYSAAFSIDGDSNTGWAIDSGSGIPATAEATFVLDPESLKAALTKAAESNLKPAFRIRLEQNHGSGHVIGEFRIAIGSEQSTAEAKQQRAELVQKTFEEWLQRERVNAVVWNPMLPTDVASNLPHLTVLEDHSILATGDTTKQDHYEIKLAPVPEAITAIRLEALPDERLPGNGPGTTFYEGSLGDFYLNEFAVFANEKKFLIGSATESYTKNKFGNTPTSAALTLDGDVQTGWSIAGEEGQRHTAVYVFERPFPANTPMKIEMIFGRHFASSLGRFRIAASTSQKKPVARRHTEYEEILLAKSASELTATEKKQLFHAFLLSAPELNDLADRIRKLLAEPVRQTTLVMQERPADNPRPTYRHHRGEYLQTREAISAGAPESLHGWPDELPRNRLGFARWLVHRTNPLTARVVVNRQWAAFFGQGIVSTLDDFGIQGTAPTHPELLDWLAVSFMDSDHWSLKSLHRRIVLSEAYRQSAETNSKATTVDPANQLLSFAPRFRLDAEIVRDSIVQAAGVLSKKRGGAPVRPIQPPGITEIAFGSPRWELSAGDDRYRRSIYTFIKRTAPFAMVTTFDGPSGEACIAKRNRSNTPLQALTLLNDPMFVDLAQQSARHLLTQKDLTDQDRVRYLFQSLLTRLPDDEELKALTDFVTHHREKFRASPDEAEKVAGPLAEIEGNSAVEQATWAALSRVVFALDEVVMRP